jgi:hypothetical protein
MRPLQQAYSSLGFIGSHMTAALAIVTQAGTGRGGRSGVERVM